MADEVEIRTTEARAKLLARLLDSAPDILRVTQQVSGLRVGGSMQMTSAGNTLTLFVPQQTRSGAGTAGIAVDAEEVGGFWAKITGNAQDGSNKRWTYAWSQATKSTAGYGGWGVLTNGLSGTTSTNPIYNSIEEGNGASGTYHNGVASTNLTGTFDVKPIPDNTYVWVRPVGLDDGSVEYWTSYENGVDGNCS